MKQVDGACAQTFRVGRGEVRGTCDGDVHVQSHVEQQRTTSDQMIESCQRGVGFPRDLLVWRRSSGIYERPVAGWAFRTSNACKGTKNSLGEPSPRYSATTKAVRPDYQNTAVGTDLRRTGTSPITTTGATTTSFMLGNG